MFGKLLSFRRRAKDPTLEQLMVVNSNMAHGVESDFIRRRHVELARSRAEMDDLYNRHTADLYNAAQQQRSDRDRAGLIDKLRKEPEPPRGA